MHATMNSCFQYTIQINMPKTNNKLDGISAFVPTHQAHPFLFYWESQFPLLLFPL